MFTAFSLRAQVSAAISGKVVDASGSAVNGAVVTVKSGETGATRSVVTDAEGNFRALSLPLGPQSVKVEKPGFKTVLRTGIRLEVGQEAVVNFKLELGDVVQQVTVSEEVPLVNTTTSPISGMVGENQVKNLPLNGRSFDQLITLNPGTVNYSAMKSANTSTSNGNTFAVAGRRTSENIFYLNGVEYTGSSQLGITPGGVSGELLGIDAIREFNVLTDVYGAEYGKRAGAQVSVVTASGTNSLHGTLFEFLRNSALDSRNFFDQASVPPFRRNQFGGALGGPLKKDKLFLFGNYEGFRQALALSSVAVVPDNNARQGLLPNSAGVPTQVANLNPAMLQYMTLWPAVNGAELLANGVPSGMALSYNNPRETIREDFGTLRTDYTLGTRDTLSGAYTIDDGSNVIPLADPLFGSNTLLRAQVASLNETHVFSPSVLNVFTAGFSRAGFAYNSFPLTSFPSSTAFVDGKGPGGIVIGGGVTTTGGGSITSAGPNNNANSWNRRNLFSYTDNVQISRGSHQISAGIWFQRVQDNEDSASRQLGQASFTNLTTFLQGTTTSFQIVGNPNELGWRSLFGAWYVQDAIRIRPHLTVQLGIRQEFTTGWNEVFGRAANYITDATGALQPDVRLANSVFTKNNATHLFAPRASIAWDVFGNGKTALRAGAGTYYSLIDDLSFLLNALPPYNGSASFTNVSFPSLVPIKLGLSPDPQCSATVPKPCANYAPQGVQPNAFTPTVEEWNATLEQQIDRNTVLRIGYAGSHGYHGFIALDPNDIPSQICSSPSGCTAGGTPGTTKSIVPQGAQYIPVQSRPDPYLGAGFFWYTEGNTSYNALELDLTRRLSRGLSFRANYTRSKNLDMNSGLTIAQSNNEPQMIMDRNNPRRDWGPSALNIANQASISGMYDLPFARHLTGLGSKVLGGWQLNAIATLLSGFPFTPLVGSNVSGDGDTRNPDRPSVNPNFHGPVILGSPNQWFNPNAFIIPAAGTYGNLGRGSFTGPGLADLDLSLFKTAPIGERASLQFRGEFFNILNHPNFASPNATAFSGGNVSGSAGLITATTTTSRQIQFGLKLIF